MSVRRQGEAANAPAEPASLVELLEGRVRGRFCALHPKPFLAKIERDGSVTLIEDFKRGWRARYTGRRSRTKSSAARGARGWEGIARLARFVESLAAKSAALRR